MRIYREGEAVLTKVGAPVLQFDHFTVETAREMYRTMFHAGGIGLAAPQVGLRLQLFVMDRALLPAGVVVNPFISASEGSKSGWEGCLSIPDKLYRVARPERVSFHAQDEYGTHYEGVVRDLAARCFMHEFDHCQGKMLSAGGWESKDR